MGTNDSWHEDYSKPLYVQNVIRRTIEGLESLTARADNLLQKIPPSLPAGDYPLRITSVNPWAPPSVPEAYLRVREQSSVLDKITRELNPTQEKFDYDLRNLVKDQESHLLFAIENFGLKKFVSPATLKKHFSQRHVRIYPVPVELAQKIHLFDCRETRDELIITPKENLLTAESANWYADNMEFTGSVYGVAQQHINMMKHEGGWKIDELGFPTSGADGVILDAYVALQDLRKIRDQLDREVQKEKGAKKARAKVSAATRTKTDSAGRGLV